MTGKQNRKISARVSAVAQNAQLYCVLAFLRLFPAADEVENGLVVQMQHKSWLCISRMTKPCNTTQYRNIMPYNTIQYHTIPYMIPCNTISYQATPIAVASQRLCIPRMTWHTPGRRAERNSSDGVLSLFSDTRVFIIFRQRGICGNRGLGCVMTHARRGFGENCVRRTPANRFLKFFGATPPIGIKWTSGAYMCPRKHILGQKWPFWAKHPNYFVREQKFWFTHIRKPLRHLVPIVLLVGHGTKWII